MCRFPSRDPAENAPHREADAGEIPTGEDVPRHDLTRCEHVLERAAAGTAHASGLIDADTGVRERQPRTEWIRAKRRSVDRASPVDARGLEARRAASVGTGRIERNRAADCGIELLDPPAQ